MLSAMLRLIGAVESALKRNLLNDPKRVHPMWFGSSMIAGKRPRGSHVPHMSSSAGSTPSGDPSDVHADRPPDRAMLVPGLSAASGSASASASEIDRRCSPRQAYEGTLLIMWHHRPQAPVRLHTLDVSEGGARVLTTCCLPEGMTGTAIELLGAMDRHLIGRTVTVVWSKAVRRDDGRLDHFEAGLRFF